MVSQVRTELVRNTLPMLLFVTVTKKSSELKRALLRVMLLHNGTGVTVGVNVFVGVLDGVGVLVGVRVGDGVKVLVGVRVGDGVKVLVGVRVGDGVKVGVRVGVSEGTTNPPPPGFGLAAGLTILAIRKASLIPER